MVRVRWFSRVRLYELKRFLNLGKPHSNCDSFYLGIAQIAFASPHPPTLLFTALPSHGFTSSRWASGTEAIAKHVAT